MNTGPTSRRDRLVAVVLRQALEGREPDQGLRPLLYAATSPAASPEDFAGPYGPKGDALVALNAFRAPVTDVELAGRVWDVTERVVGAERAHAAGGVVPLSGG